MGQYIAFDTHKRYTLASVETSNGTRMQEAKILHKRGALAQFLNRCETGSPVAVETVGNWYWIVDEIEQAGCKPRLVHARKAKLMMGMINKTDKLDVRGLNRLQRNGTLPTVWVPPGEIRDQRELPRTRMALVRMRTLLKNRIHATLDKYAVQVEGVTDLFGVTGRALLEKHLPDLPPETRRCVQQELELVDTLGGQIGQMEKRIREEIQETPEMQILMTIPGVGPILATVISLEVGDVHRFPDPQHLASYAGTVARVDSSGGKTRYGRVRKDANQYLKWAYVEAANCIVKNHTRMEGRHVVRLYRRVQQRKGHGKAKVAVARHLSEATWWMLMRKVSYQEPKPPVSSTHG